VKIKGGVKLSILYGNPTRSYYSHTHEANDCKIADTLLKRGTKKHTDGWDSPCKTRSHMVLHLSHTEGVIGVTFNDITKDVVFYTTTSRFVS
jgi:hypothetical protein